MNKNIEIKFRKIDSQGSLVASEENLEHDIFVKMPPKKSYKIKGKIVSSKQSNHNLPPMETSKNKRAEKIVGKRNIPKDALIFDQPCELGYHCPICKYPIIDKKHDNFDSRLQFSEYRTFLWCEVCNVDYPSCLCMPDIEKAIEIYLDCIEEYKKGNK